MGKEFQYSMIMGKEFQYSMIMGKEFEYSMIMGKEFQYSLIMGKEFQYSMIMGKEFQALTHETAESWSRDPQTDWKPINNQQLKSKSSLDSPLHPKLSTSAQYRSPADPAYIAIWIWVD